MIMDDEHINTDFRFTSSVVNINPYPTVFKSDLQILESLVFLVHHYVRWRPGHHQRAGGAANTLMSDDVHRREAVRLLLMLGVKNLTKLLTSLLAVL